MPASTVGLIYSATTARLRAVVVPDSDAQLSNYPLGTGEALLVVSAAAYSAAGDAQTLVSQQLGRSPANDRYAVIDAGNNVVAAIVADPEGCGDNIAGLALIAHPTAGPGWQCWSGTFINPSPISSVAFPARSGLTIRAVSRARDLRFR